MKTHTSDFKNNIKNFAREIDTKITYQSNGETIELGVEELNSVTPHYEGAILKSVMKQLDIDSNVDIPVNTTLNAQFGVKVGGEYEYINLGTFVVKTSKKQEDTSSYKITCYDKMLYSMKNYAGLTVSYPITIRNYLASICSYLGIGFANASDTFANYDKEIEKELYLGQGYTFRDVLDQIAQATASTICINNNDYLEVRYITETNDTIDEDFFKDINVNFGEKYGPVNSIVLSRSAESDNVYLRDEESVTQNGLCEIKIVDNQIMNWNDRSDYLPDILEKLDGLEYHLNDFASPGITYYDLCDRYTVQIGENEYSCIMLNDEINITQGLEENVHTDLLIQSETDYTKADKTDRKINQVYLIVDKQNGTIQSLVSAVGEQSTQISTIEQSVDNLSLRVEDVNEGLVSSSSTLASISLEKVAEGNPIYIQVYPMINDISKTYPYKSLFPSLTTYLKVKILRFTNTVTSEIFDYEIPYDLFYLDNTTYDEFVLDSENESCYIIRRVGFDNNGDKYKLNEEVIVPLTYPTINLTAGNYTVQLIGYTTGYLKVRLNGVVKWATKAELNLTASEISLEVSKKVDEDDYTAARIVAMINDSGSAVMIEADKVDISASDVLNIIAGSTINLTSKNINIDSTNFSVSSTGHLTCEGATLTGGSIHLYNENQSSFNYLIVGDVSNIGSINYGDKYSAMQKNLVSVIDYTGATVNQSYLNKNEVVFTGGNYGASIGLDGAYISTSSANDYIKISDGSTNGSYMSYAGMWAAAYNNTSLESLKKNITADEGCLNQILNTDICNYNYKFEDDSDKKHVGLIIPDEGGNYRYAEKALAHDRDSVDVYSATMMAWKAIQEQQEMINELQEEIRRLKGEL